MLVRTTHTHTHKSYYLIFVVRTEQPPDTSEITLANLQGAHVAVARRVTASSSSLFNLVLGTGNTGTFPTPQTPTTPDSNTVAFNDIPLRAGVTYYFFVRLYSEHVRNSLYTDWGTTATHLVTDRVHITDLCAHTINEFPFKCCSDHNTYSSRSVRSMYSH